MKKLKLNVAIMLSLSMFLLQLTAGLGYSTAGAAPVIGGTPGPGDVIEYFEKGNPVGIAPGINISDSTPSAVFADGNVVFEIAEGSSSNERLLLPDGASVATSSGMITVNGKTILLNGNPIGAVDTALNGDGKALQINFSTPLANGDFSQTDGSGNPAGWTVNKQVVKLGDLASRTQGAAYESVVANVYGGFTATVTNAVYPYAYDTDVNYWAGASENRYEAVERDLSGTGTFNGSVVSGALELESNGSIVGPNAGTFGSVFGPEAISSTFKAGQGDTLVFDWKAAGGGDDYEVYGFLVNADDEDDVTLLMYGRGKNTIGTNGWITANGEIPADGNYYFRFVSGTYDKTGGFVVGAKLYIDNVRVLSGAITAEVASAVAGLVAYENTGYPEPLVPARTVKITATNSAGETGPSPAAEVNVLLQDEEQLRLINTKVKDSTPNEAELTFNLPVNGDAAALNLDGLTVGGRKVIGIKSVAGNVIVAELEGPVVNPAPGADPALASIPVEYDPSKGNIQSAQFPNNKLQVIPASPAAGSQTGGLEITPLKLVKVVASSSDPNQLKLKFNKPIATGDDLDLTGLTVDGKPVKLVSVNGDEVIVELEQPYQAGQPLAYDSTNGQIGDAAFPDLNKLGSIPATGAGSIPVLAGKLPSLGLNYGDNNTAVGLEPDYDSNKGDYTGAVPNDVKSIHIAPVASPGETVKVKLNGVEVNSANGSWDELPLQEGPNEIVVTAYDEETGEPLNSYTVVVWRAASKLVNLAPSVGQLTEAFNSGKYDYVINVGSDTNGINLTPTALDPEAKIEVSINGGAKAPVASGTATEKLPLQTGKNTIVFTVTDRFGHVVEEYTVVVNRSSSYSYPSMPTEQKEKITVDVVIGGDKAADTTKVEIERTTHNNGKVTDLVVLTPQKASETAEKAKESGEQIARIVIPDPQDKVSEVKVEIPKAALAILKENKIDLEIYNENGIVHVPNSSLQGVDKDSYFRLVPLKDAGLRTEFEQRARTEEGVLELAKDGKVEVLSRPLTIETNMGDRPVTLTLPLKGVKLPTDANEREAYLSKLAVYAEQADGSKEIIVGKVVTLANGELGLSFDTDKFGTYTVLHLASKADGNHEKYINGYPDGTFRPGQGVTRAELAAMLVRLGAAEDTASSSKQFSDVPASHWASKYISQVSAAGLLNGYPEGTFRPEVKVTRAEVSAVIYNYLGLTPQADAHGFSDVASSYWANDFITAVNAKGLITGFENGTFQPRKELTRAETVTVLNRLFERGPLKGAAASSWSDVPASHWAYNDINEASSDHAYIRLEEGGEQRVAQ